MNITNNAGSVTQLSPTSYAIPYTIRFTNTGEQGANFPQVLENFRRSYGSQVAATVEPGSLTSSPVGGVASSGCAVNTNFDGYSDQKMLTGSASDTFAPGDGCEITFTVILEYGNSSIRTNSVNSSVYGSFTFNSPNNGGTLSDDPSIQPAVAQNTEVTAYASTAVVLTLRRAIKMHHKLPTQEYNVLHP